MSAQLPSMEEIVRLQAAVSAGSLDEVGREQVARLVEQVGLSMVVASELGVSAWEPVAELYAVCVRGAR